MTPRTRVASIAMLVVLAAACSSTKSSAPSTTTTTTTKYTPVYTKGACNDEAPRDALIECGTLTVPEDRSKPDGRKVTIAVAIVHTADPNPAPDPVVYFEGGPGGPAIPTAQLFLRKSLSGNRDVIILDQRGTGKSDPNLDCPELHDATATVFGAADGFDAESKVITDAARACLARLRATGIDLNQYNTERVADDVADLRTAIGIKEWNLFGVSYGTEVALQVLRAHPDGVRSVTIDSVLPPDVGGTVVDGVASFRRAERVFFEGCQKDARCHAAFPNLEADLNALVAELDASPYRSTITNPVLKRQTPIVITGADALSGFFNALYSASIIPQLPGIIEQVKAAHGGPIVNQLTMQGILSLNDINEAQAIAVTCHDRGRLIHDDDTARVLKNDPETSTILLPAGASCHDSGITEADPSYNQPEQSDLPALVLAGEYDPITPPDQSKQAASTLTHSTFVEFPGLAHGEVFAPPSCPDDIFRAFLASPTAPVDTSCVASIGPPNWAVP